MYDGALKPRSPVRPREKTGLLDAHAQPFTHGPRILLHGAIACSPAVTPLDYVPIADLLNSAFITREHEGDDCRPVDAPYADSLTLAL